MQASLIPDYTNSSVSKKVDFGIYIEPSNDLERSAQESVEDTISRCRKDLPGTVFNFTDATPLAHRPITFIIETKKPSAGFDGSKLQLDIWQNAHWTFLRHLAQIASDRCTVTEETAGVGLEAMETVQEHTNTGDGPKAQKTFNLPNFIPGIIIQGHLWHLIITTPQDRKTMIWQSIGMGNTQSTKGIYQINSVSVTSYRCPGHPTMDSSECQDIETVDATKHSAVASDAIRIAASVSSSWSASGSSTQTRTSKSPIATLETIEVANNIGDVPLSAAPSRCHSIFISVARETHLKKIDSRRKRPATTDCRSSDVRTPAYKVASALSSGIQKGSSPSHRQPALTLTHYGDDSDSDADGES
ncbi:hypothetical protein FBULB1_13385 [Fusarium bulbicola]|nr:hypothetical protein FBULB1_13385 [Fusarium bulbicola]